MPKKDHHFIINSDFYTKQQENSVNEKTHFSSALISHDCTIQEWRTNLFNKNSECVLSLFSRVRLFATLWTVALQAPLSMGFSRQGYWSGLLCPPPGIFLTQGSNLLLLHHLHCMWILDHFGNPYVKNLWRQVSNRLLKLFRPPVWHSNGGSAGLC